MDASNLEGIEEVAEQATIRVNERHHHGRIGWSISPSLERAAGHCAKTRAPPPDRPPAARPTAPLQQSPRSCEQPAPVPIRSMADFLTALRITRDERQLTHETIDEIAGLPSGYCGKLLSPIPIRNLGWLSFDLVP